jgi:hypothetical protein
MEEILYKVYIKTDAASNITTVNSSAFLNDTTGWIQIDEGTGDKYHHAQGNYFDKPIITSSGVYRYKLVDGAAVEKTAEKILVEAPDEMPTEAEQMRADIDYLAALAGVTL